MAMPAFGGNGFSTLPPPFGIPGGIGSFGSFGSGSTFRPPMGFGTFPQNQQQQGFPQNNMNPMNGMMPNMPQNNMNGMNQPQPPMNGMFNNQNQNQGPQMGQLGGFTNGFAVPNQMMGGGQGWTQPPTGGMFPQQGSFPGFPGLPGSPRPQFNPISDVTSPPLHLKKREANMLPPQARMQPLGQQQMQNGQMPQQPNMQSNSNGQIPQSGFRSNGGSNNQGTFQKSGMPQTFPDNSQGRFGSPKTLQGSMEPKRSD
uniref:Uncharacterized protein n=1 Tax=Panagrolaimus davidi TaxID=227884 RepID=A0A914QRT2_9BILA